ncbi:MAG TPA: hydroxymethylglutaryl-CoA lyase [Ktedonobacterales bacterium]|jgi:isopropylmalate/homocitrate/citramalate synthase|nr:hydroxymethylglutaryl-CoA lyase [Ktedonobacterales bacterium]
MSAISVGLPERVTVVEVGPRDGLQNESEVIATDDKVRFIDLLSAAGFTEIEATSFVSPRAVPQLADASEVMARIQRRPGVRFSALVPNERGMERALAAGVDEIAVFTGASETFVRHNINTTIAGSIETFKPVVAQVREAGLRLRGYISTVFGCPYEGYVAPEAVLNITRQLLDLGADELSYGDTIGVATPNRVTEMVARLAEVVPLDQVSMHFHDTRGTALANVLAGLQAGVTIFDSSAGGLGGCPYAPGASGNVSTEDLLYMLHGMGIQTGIDLNAVVEASRFLASVRRVAPASRYYAAATATK